MPMLYSVLRQKRLRRTQRLHELAIVRSHRDTSAQVLATVQRQHEEARATLWQTMTAEELCVQRWSIARAQESSTHRSLDEAAATHSANVDECERLQHVIARIEKDMEKLQERAEQGRQEKESGRRLREWSDLDDWVLGRHGAMK